MCLLMDFAVDAAARGSAELCGTNVVIATGFFSPAAVTVGGTRMCISICKVYHRQDYKKKTT